MSKQEVFHCPDENKARRVAVNLLLRERVT